jgi:hypothetical protein
MKDVQYKTQITIRQLLSCSDGIEWGDRTSQTSC